jgi:hypothetical protein
MGGVGGTPLYLQSVLAVVLGDVVGDMEDELRKAC